MEQIFKTINKLKQLIDVTEKAFKDYKEKHKSDTVPEFKVGDWVIGKNRCLPKKPSLIRKFYEYNLMDYDDFEGATKQVAWKGYIRHATKEEIESHLRKICDEKYIGKKAQCLRNAEDKKTIKKFIKYNYDEDCIIYNDKWELNMYVYEKGKFASIIPDKKKLPKKRGEYKQFLDDFWHALPESIIDGLSINEFLDQYED